MQQFLNIWCATGLTRACAAFLPHPSMKSFLRRPNGHALEGDGKSKFSRDQTSWLGKQVSMDARISIKTRLPSRHDGSTNAALRLPAIAPASGVGLAEICLAQICLAQIFSAEIFKKTPCAAGLKPGGRDAAKDMFEIGCAPLPMTTLNVKLTGAERAQCETKWRARHTNHTSGALVTHPGSAHEKQCYADI